MVESRIDHAKIWAGMKHKGQARKYTGEPYVEHPIAVSELVREHGLSETAIIAAILHDTVEDTDATLEDVWELFGEEVAEYVWYLTKPPEFVGNRSIRKEHDRNRLAIAPEEVKFIKFYDVFTMPVALKSMTLSSGSHGGTKCRCYSSQWTCIPWSQLRQNMKNLLGRYNKMI